MTSTPTTANYFTVALADDLEQQGVPLDKAEIRKQRIEAAVQRSKTEYKAEHAYTERGVSWVLPVNR
jgi:hypothetical protein